MKWAVVVLLTALSQSPAVMAGTPNANAILAQISFQQRLNHAIPLQLAVRNVAGKTVTLRNYFTHTPLILALAWYSCRNICGVELRDLALSLKTVDLTPGKDYQVLTVSIDPRDDLEQARQTRKMMLAQYGGLAHGLHVVTAKPAVIRQLADAIGYRYTYDTRLDQYAHPAGIVILTPDGMISRYLLGLLFPQDTLFKALVQAGEGKIGNVIDSFITRCYTFDPTTGRYTLSILSIARYAGIGFALLLAAGIGILLWRERRSRAALSAQFSPTEKIPR